MDRNFGVVIIIVLLASVFVSALLNEQHVSGLTLPYTITSSSSYSISGIGTLTVAADNVEIVDSVITASGTGIYSYGRNNLTVRNCVVYDCGSYGLRFWEGEGLTVINCTFRNNGSEDVSVWYASNVLLQDNSFLDNAVYGCKLNTVTDFTVKGNLVDGNLLYGLVTQNCHSGAVEYNLFQYNKYAYVIDGGSYDVTVRYNWLLNNTQAVVNWTNEYWLLDTCVFVGNALAIDGYSAETITNCNVVPVYAGASKYYDDSAWQPAIPEEYPEPTPTPSPTIEPSPTPEPTPTPTPSFQPLTPEEWADYWNWKATEDPAFRSDVEEWLND